MKQKILRLIIIILCCCSILTTACCPQKVTAETSQFYTIEDFANDQEEVCEDEDTPWGAITITIIIIIIIVVVILTSAGNSGSS